MGVLYWVTTAYFKFLQKSPILTSRLLKIKDETFARMLFNLKISQFRHSRVSRMNNQLWRMNNELQLIYSADKPNTGLVGIFYGDDLYG